MIEDEGL
jgi:hypothetical protein